MKQSVFFVQPLLVTSASTAHKWDDASILEQNVLNRPAISYQSSAVPELQTVFANVPVLYDDQLTADYKLLGNALGSMAELGPETDWGIEPSVYAAARTVATALRDGEYPAPKIFTHGSDSVVFTWANQINKFYLTVSSDGMSVLVSSPQRIEHRAEVAFGSRPALEKSLRYLPATSQEPSIVKRLSGSSDDASLVRK